MHFLRSERAAAGLLLTAAVLGLVVANTAIGPNLITFTSDHRNIPWLGLDLSISHWVSDGLLAVFFFVVAIELKRELAIGELNSASRAVLPAIAALGGVAVPAGVYLAITAGSDVQAGWPIPTATDIAFALGVLAVFGRGIPTRIRVFLMALAVLDDLVAILIIAFFFTADVRLDFLGFAAIAITAFAALSRMLRPRSSWVLKRRSPTPIVLTMVILGILAWYFTYQSGVHATIAGVVLGLSMSRVPGGRVAHTLEPYSNGIVLPLFAFAAAMVAIPQVRIGDLSPAFFGILIALPVGKLIGITVAGWIGMRVSRRRGRGTPLTFLDLGVVAALGGIGFTVSLLMNELAFEGNDAVADEGTLAVLLGSTVSIILSGVFVSLRALHYRRLHERNHPRQPYPEPDDTTIGEKIV